MEVTKFIGVNINFTESSVDIYDACRKATESLPADNRIHFCRVAKSNAHIAFIFKHGDDKYAAYLGFSYSQNPYFQRKENGNWGSVVTL